MYHQVCMCVCVCLRPGCVISVCQNESATKRSLLQTILTSLHAPCHILTLSVLQLNAANATTYQKAPPKGEDTKSQKRHDFNNWVYSPQKNLSFQGATLSKPSFFGIRC